MKQKLILLALLVICVSTSSFQCQQCKTGTALLGNSRSWLPLKGKTQLSFIDPSGNSVHFKLRVVDTLETLINDCNEPFSYEYINASLILNQTQTDSINFTLSAKDWMCAFAWSDSNISMSMCNVFGQAKEGVIARKLRNYTAGNNLYQEAIMLLGSAANSNKIDSVVIAKNAGIVAFSYAARKYVLL